LVGLFSNIDAATPGKRQTAPAIGAQREGRSAGSIASRRHLNAAPSLCRAFHIAVHTHRDRGNERCAERNEKMPGLCRMETEIAGPIGMEEDDAGTWIALDGLHNFGELDLDRRDKTRCARFERIGASGRLRILRIAERCSTGCSKTGPVEVGAGVIGAIVGQMNSEGAR